jgi:predicted DNA-binding transcriptional regulator AlpA
MDEQIEEWLVKDCAAHWGVKPSTWRSYVARGQAPQPVRKVGRESLWDAAEVRAYSRPGQGARTDRAAAEVDEPAEVDER